MAAVAGCPLELPILSRHVALRMTDQKPDGHQGTDPLKPERPIQTGVRM